MHDNATEQMNDPVFRQEQQHLNSTYATLEDIGRNLARQVESTRQAAAADKRSMSEELSPNLASYADAMETYADFAAMNRVIDGYNAVQDAATRKLADIALLLGQPYFAKVVLQFKPDAPPREIYLGNAGMSDDSCRRMVVDWRSPVAEVYYNQDNGPTSYLADGRTIQVDLKLRRQFDIEGSRLNAYFDTSVAVQDSLLLASLSKHRTAHMQAITATIQREQNLVVRHADVPTLLVSGIAGSGKTSVLLQRLAYLFYQQRESLNPADVFLVTPNPVFRHYIDNVLADLGERNPNLLTLGELMARLMPPDRSHGEADVPLDTLERIDRALASLSFEPDDFKDIRSAGTRLVSAAQIQQVAAKFKRIPAGPHLVTLMREELGKRLESRLQQMSGSEDVQDEMAALSIDEQLDLFHETIDPQSEQEERTLARRWLNARHADALRAVENDDWLRIDRIGMRLLGEPSLAPVTWLYLKMALTGLGNPQAKYVLVDEVQDYTAAQLAVLARYFRRAHFLLLGDENQAIKPHTASFDDVRAVFAAQHGPVEECQLLTSYRSAPAITALFASLLDRSERMRVSSVQRDDVPPTIVECPNEQAYCRALREALARARTNEGLTAVIVPWKREALRLQELAGKAAPPLVGRDAAMPESGAMLITLELAKGLEFDHVIVPDASQRVFPDDPLSRRRLYTTISRATRTITLLAPGKLTPLLSAAVAAQAPRRPRTPRMR